MVKLDIIPKSISIVLKSVKKRIFLRSKPLYELFEVVLPLFSLGGWFTSPNISLAEQLCRVVTGLDCCNLTGLPGDSVQDIKYIFKYSFVLYQFSLLYIKRRTTLLLDLEIVLWSGIIDIDEVLRRYFVRFRSLSQSKLFYLHLIVKFLQKYWNKK